MAVDDRRQSGSWWLIGVAVLVAFGGLGLAGCPPTMPTNPVGFENISDPTNNGATFVGSPSCRGCHADIGALVDRHGHAQAIQALQGAAPVFPETARDTSIPSPPADFAWTAFSHVVGGYRKSALFVDQNGFFATTGETGVDTQWNAALPHSGIERGFAPYLPDATEPVPFDFECFRCHATGAQSAPPGASVFQGGRAGMAGSWHEAGVGCEACHGPGSNHFGSTGADVTIDTAGVFVDPDGGNSCRHCHGGGADGDDERISAADGFITHYEQWSELRASGGHADFACTVCHDPHVSLTTGRETAIRNDCTACHAEMSMAGHRGATFRRGEFAETLRCESCHMPYAGMNLTRADASVVGEDARVGDVRAHIFRIDVREGDFNMMFNEDGTRVRTDSQGRAAVTVDFVCLRCHNGLGNVFPLTLERAAEIAPNVHALPE